MIVAEILAEIHKHKLISPPTLYKHLKALKIKPIGNARRCPQRYPKNTPQRILKRLGVQAGKAGAR